MYIAPGYEPRHFPAGDPAGFCMLPSATAPAARFPQAKACSGTHPHRYGYILLIICIYRQKIPRPSLPGSPLPSARFSKAQFALPSLFQAKKFSIFCGFLPEYGGSTCIWKSGTAFHSRTEVPTEPFLLTYGLLCPLPDPFPDHRHKPPHFPAK